MKKQNINMKEQNTDTRKQNADIRKQNTEMSKQKRKNKMHVSGKVIKAALTAVCMSMLILCACGSKGAKTKSLYEQGLDVVRLMSEMARSEEYVKLFIGNDGIRSIVQDIGAGDYTSPKAVYEISIDGEGFAAMTELYGIGEIPEELRHYLTGRLFGALITQINARGGVENVAAASACTVEKMFVNEEADENRIYLYTYDNAVPVAVAFLVGEDHAVLARGVFILYDEFPEGSADEIRSFFDSAFFGFGIEVTEVVKK